MTLLELVSHKYTVAHHSVIKFIQENVASLKDLDAHSSLALSNVFRLIHTKGSNQNKMALA